MNTQFIHKLFIKYQYYSLIYSNTNFLDYRNNTTTIYNIDAYLNYRNNRIVLVSHILLYAKNYPNSNLAKSPIILKYNEETAYRLIQNLNKVIRLL
jgi:hypothetical protein